MTTALALIETVKAVEIYANNGMDPLLDKIKEHVRSFVPDLSTAKGRKEIASMAYKVAQSKTHLDNLGKELTADWKKKAKVVDDERKKMREELDALKDEVRKPLTDFEEAEKARIDALNARILAIKALATDVDDDGKKLSSVCLFDNLVVVKVIDIESFGEMAKEAALAKESAVRSLEAHIARRTNEEAEAAELERLRREAAEREEADRVERIRKEAEEKAKREAEEVARKERERVEAEKAEAELKAKEERERLEREKAEAEAAIIREREEAKRREEEAERKRVADLKAAQEKADREKAEAEARRLADIKAAEEKAERERLDLIRQQEEKERVARLKKEEEEEAERKRQADTKHRAAINNNILSALKNCGCDDAVGKAIIKAIVAGHIPNVTVRY